MREQIILADLVIRIIKPDEELGRIAAEIIQEENNRYVEI